MQFAEEYCKNNNLGKIKIIMSVKEAGDNLQEMIISVEKNGFVKEVDYDNSLGKQIIYAKMVNGDKNADD